MSLKLNQYSRRAPQAAVDPAVRMAFIPKAAHGNGRNSCLKYTRFTGYPNKLCSFPFVQSYYIHGGLSIKLGENKGKITRILHDNCHFPALFTVIILHIIAECSSMPIFVVNNSHKINRHCQLAVPIEKWQIELIPAGRLSCGPKRPVPSVPRFGVIRVVLEVIGIKHPARFVGYGIVRRAVYVAPLAI